MDTNFEPHKCVIFVQSMKIDICQTKAVLSFRNVLRYVYNCHFLIFGKICKIIFF